MKITKLLSWIAFVWFIISSGFRPVILIHQYKADELFQLRFRLCEPHPALHFHRDIAYQPRRKYIHRGSRRGYISDTSRAIPSLWSSNPRPSKKYPRATDHSVLAKLPRSADTKVGKNDLTFGLWNIRSLSNKGPVVYDLLSDRKFDFLCLTETWQQSNDSTQPFYSPGLCLHLQTPCIGPWWGFSNIT